MPGIPLQGGAFSHPGLPEVCHSRVGVQGDPWDHVGPREPKPLQGGASTPSIYASGTVPGIPVQGGASPTLAVSGTLGMAVPCARATPGGLMMWHRFSRVVLDHMLRHGPPIPGRRRHFFITCTAFGYGAGAPGELRPEAPRSLQEGVLGPRLTKGVPGRKPGAPIPPKGKAQSPSGG